MADEQEVMSVDEDESSSSEGSDTDKDDDQEKELLKRAEELEKQIGTNKYLYHAHEEIVELYRKIGDLNSMREAYERFHECFPLTPKLWLSWINDEIKIAQTLEEQNRVIELFDKAVDDYLSVDLWIEYAQYSIGARDLETTRSILERGLIVGGLHVSDGSLLWDTLRELENAHVGIYEQGSEEWKEQIMRLAEVFKRQLSVPLFGMENTYHEWQEWMKTLPSGLIDPKPVEWAYNKALHLLEIYKPFEEKLMMAHNDNYDLQEYYKEYIKAVKDPSTMVCLYERALVPLCLIPELWVDYCMSSIGLGEAAVKVSSRALRNCPWSEDLWVARLRILEHNKKDEEEILGCFEGGLLSISPNLGIELWLSYLECIHRNDDDFAKLDKLFVRAAQQFDITNDPTSKLRRYHARLLAKKGDMASARKIWNFVVSQHANKGSVVVWLEYANLERQYGEPNQLRSIFKRALATKTDWPQCISEEWLMYEREFGTLEDLLKCTDKIKSLATIQTSQNVSTSNTEMTYNPRQRDTKRKREDRDQEANYKKTKFEKSAPSTFNRKPKFGLGYREKHDSSTAVPRKRVDKNPKTTVFISNLHVSSTEDMLKELFPNAEVIEIVRDRRGKSRCYGYMQFVKEEEAMTALARDRVPLDGRPVFISEIKGEKTERKPAFKYAATTEANKLFVRGLPSDKSKEEVAEVFKQFSPKDVRLVMKKSGEGKGIAYVEFETEEAAREAMKATDQLKLDDDHIISVAISQPPVKRSTNFVPIPKSEPVRHSRSRLQLPLIPRTLQIKTGKTEGNETGGSGVKPKSNSDFRSMLLKK